MMVLPPYEEVVTLPAVRVGVEGERSVDDLFGGQRAWLVRRCAGIVRNADAAEDLAQETLLEAWRNRHKLRDEAGEKGDEVRRWLGAVAQNVCLRWLREEGHERAYRMVRVPWSGGEAMGDGQEGDGWSVDDVAAPDIYGVEIELERSELSALLQQGLDYLSETLRTPLVARYLEGATHDEMTRQLQVSEATLVQRIYRGKQALRTVLTTHMSRELAAYGICAPGTRAGSEATRLWCPWCGDAQILMKEDLAAGKRSFRCQGCHVSLGGSRDTSNWPQVSSAGARCTQLLKWLYGYYWQAIDLEPSCFFCRKPATLTVKRAGEMPSRYDRLGEQAGVEIFCAHCQRMHYNTLSHLTFNLPQVRRFWNRYKRIEWRPGERVEHEGIATLVSVFQRKGSEERVSVLVEEGTLRVLGIEEGGK